MKHNELTTKSIFLEVHTVFATANIIFFQEVILFKVKLLQQ